MTNNATFEIFVSQIQTLPTEQVESALMFLMGVVGLIAAFAAICVLLAAAARFMLFRKAGESGWKAFIPFLSGYTQYKLTWKPSMFFITMAVGALSVLMSMLVGIANSGGGSASLMLQLADVAATIGHAALLVISLYKLAKAYGKDKGFTVGLVVLNTVFMMILGFGKSTYIGNGEN